MISNSYKVTSNNRLAISISEFVQLNPGNNRREAGQNPVGIETVHSLIEYCPRLAGLGNLRTWRNIDYYNPSDPNYYKSEESSLGKLKEQSKQSNWDLDLDIENLDYLYNKLS